MVGWLHFLGPEGRKSHYGGEQSRAAHFLAVNRREDRGNKPIRKRERKREPTSSNLAPPPNRTMMKLASS
jgi:hypothetical protein